MDPKCKLQNRVGIELNERKSKIKKNCELFIWGFGWDHKK
jgi:hypothetical protein